MIIALWYETHLHVVRVMKLNKCVGTLWRTQSTVKLQLFYSVTTGENEQILSKMKELQEVES